MLQLYKARQSPSQLSIAQPPAAQGLKANSQMRALFAYVYYIQGTSARYTGDARTGRARMQVALPLPLAAQYHT